jgi:hypothetical protein
MKRFEGLIHSLDLPDKLGFWGSCSESFYLHIGDDPGDVWLAVLIERLHSMGLAKGFEITDPKLRSNGKMTVAGITAEMNVKEEAPLSADFNYTDAVTRDVVRQLTKLLGVTPTACSGCHHAAIWEVPVAGADGVQVDFHWDESADENVGGTLAVSWPKGEEPDDDDPRWRVINEAKQLFRLMIDTSGHKVSVN